SDRAEWLATPAVAPAPIRATARCHRTTKIRAARRRAIENLPVGHRGTGIKSRSGRFALRGPMDSKIRAVEQVGAKEETGSRHRIGQERGVAVKRLHPIGQDPRLPRGGQVRPRTERARMSERNEALAHSGTFERASELEARPLESVGEVRT